MKKKNPMCFFSFFEMRGDRFWMTCKETRFIFIFWCVLTITMDQPRNVKKVNQFSVISGINSYFFMQISTISPIENFSKFVFVHYSLRIHFISWFAKENLKIILFSFKLLFFEAKEWIPFTLQTTFYTKIHIRLFCMRIIQIEWMNLIESATWNFNMVDSVRILYVVFFLTLLFLLSSLSTHRLTYIHIDTNT